MKNDPLNDEPSASDAEELFWQALRYVQNDLSDAEQAEFETCLGDDPAACEAVADAMRLTAGLNLAGLNLVRQTEMPRPLPAAARSPSGRLLPVTLSAALLFATGLAFTFWPSSPPTVTDLASLELVNRWRLDSPFAGAEFHDLDELNDDDAEVLDESLSAPGWMMSAVRLSDELGAHSRVD